MLRFVTLLAPAVLVTRVWVLRVLSSARAYDVIRLTLIEGMPCPAVRSHDREFGEFS